MADEKSPSRISHRLLATSRSEKRDKMRKMWNSRIAKGLRIIICAMLIVYGFYAVPTYAAQRTIVDGPSMESNYYDGENLIACKCMYRFVDPERFDVVVFYPNGKTTGFVDFLENIGKPKRKEDEYFVMGDNRTVSEDSRYFGPVKK